MSRVPTVLIGLPIYNGQKYIAQAIESVLNQSFEDFAVLISDNASTDGTWDTCRAYAERDSRIRLRRNERNLGAFANFRSVLDGAQSPYFMWMSHDDVLHPDYVRNCYDFLAAHPDYVLCFSKNGYIDEDGLERDVYGYSMNKYVGVESDDMEERFAACLENLPPPTEIYGLIRRDALVDLKSFRLYDGNDQAMVLELALVGKSRKLEQVLRYYRIRTTKSTNYTRLVTNYTMLRTPGAGVPLIPFTRCSLGLLAVPLHKGLDRKTEVRLFWRCLKHRRIWTNVAADLIRLVQLALYRWPRLYNFLRRFAVKVLDPGRRE